MASTFIGNVEGEPVRRWCAKEKIYKPISCPQMVNEYNKFMEGVDLCDMLLSLYRIRLKSNKWYMSVFYYLVKVSVTNAEQKTCTEDITQRHRMGPSN